MTKQQKSACAEILERIAAEDRDRVVINSNTDRLKRLKQKRAEAEYQRDLREANK